MKGLLLFRTRVALSDAIVLATTTLVLLQASAAEQKPGTNRTPAATPLASVGPKSPVNMPALATPLLPDLKVTPKSTNHWGPAYDFVIENVGRAPSKEAAIRFSAMYPCAVDPNHFLPQLGSGKVFENGKVKALAVTTSPSYAFSYSVVMPLEYRGCGLLAEVNPDHQVAEMSHDNNVAFQETKTPPRPDLVVSILDHGPQGPAKDSIRVTNEGRAPAGPSILRVWSYPKYSTGHSWNIDVPALAVGQKYEVESPIIFENLGYGGFAVLADANYQVDESNEDNNHYPRYQ